MTGKLPSPTVTRKHGDATTETDGGGAGQGHVDKQVTIRKHSKEQLEAEGKTVGVHLQYMQGMNELGVNESVSLILDFCFSFFQRPRQ